MRTSVAAISQVCGWVICFRVILDFLKRWILWILPLPLQLLIIGTLELSNGILALSSLSDEWMRFFFCEVFLSFGGLAVLMQTYAVCDSDIGLYLPGKLLQSIISAVLALAMGPLLFHTGSALAILPAVVAFAFIFLYRYFKNYSRNPVSAGV